MSIISDAKEIADLVKQLGNIELYKKIVELEGNIIELTREKNGLEDKVGSLQKSLSISQNLEFKEPFYFMKGDPVPYCSKCWESERKAIHVVEIYRESDHYRRDCPNCKIMFTVHT